MGRRSRELKARRTAAARAGRSSLAPVPELSVPVPGDARSSEMQAADVALGEISAVLRQVRSAEVALVRAERAARRAGVPWVVIGRAHGIGGQAALKAHDRRAARLGVRSAVTRVVRSEVGEVAGVG